MNGNMKVQCPARGKSYSYIRCSNFVSKLPGVAIELTGSPPTKAAAFHLLVCHISDHSHARSINEARELQEQVQVASIVQFCQHRS